MNMDYSIIKYPRTPHIEGSRLQPGDEALSQIPFDNIAGRHIVIEEKIDGANSALSFNPEGELLLQSRGATLQAATVSAATSFSSSGRACTGMRSGMRRATATHAKGGAES